MLLERKTISIYAFELEPTLAITYTINSESSVEGLQFWIREDLKYDYRILRKILEMFSQLENIEPFSEVIEKDIFRAYQEIFDIEDCITKNYKITTKEFTTKKMALALKPYRDFVKVTKLGINIFIKNYIEKGDLKW